MRSTIMAPGDAIQFRKGARKRGWELGLGVLWTLHFSSRMGCLHRPDQALHLLPRQAPLEGPPRGGGRGVPDGTGHRAGGLGLDPEPGPVCPAVSVQAGAWRGDRMGHGVMRANPAGRHP